MREWEVRARKGREEKGGKRERERERERERGISFLFP